MDEHLGSPIALVVENKDFKLIGRNIMGADPCRS